MRRTLFIAVLFCMPALSQTAFAEGTNWLNEIFPKSAVKPAANVQAQGVVQPQAPQAPEDVMLAQQEAMKRQEEAFEMQRELQKHAMQRQRETFEAQQLAERESFDASQKAQRDDFEAQQLAQQEAFKARQAAQEQDMQNQLDAFNALQQAASDYTGRMEPQRKVSEK